MNRRTKLNAICLTILSLILTSIARADETKNNSPLFDFEKITLSNGLQVITLEDFSCPIVAVQIWYHIGSKNEDPNRQGFAHMFEHMMFRGTDRLGPTDHFSLLRGVGGSTNGNTSFDRTVYLETVPANQLELALWLEAERMAFLKIDEESFVTERKVVEEELRNGLNEPYGTLVENIFAQLYKKHPYRWMPIGKIAHLEASTTQELKNFWLKYYVPNNATLIIVGAVKHQDAQKLAKQYFGWIPRSADPDRVTIKEPKPTEKRSITLKEANAPAPLAGFIWRTVPLRDKDTIALDLLSEILGGGNSSRIYRELVAKQQLAMQAQTFHWSLEQDGVFAVGAVLSPFGCDADKALSELQKQIDLIRTTPITNKELTKAKNQMLRSLVTQNLSVESKARMLGSAAVVLGDISEVNRQFDQVKNVTADDILRVAKKYLSPEAALEVKVERNISGAITSQPTTKPTTQISTTVTTTSAPAAPKRVRAEDFPTSPPIAKMEASKLSPKFARKILPNGLEVMVVSNHEVPFISVQLGLLAGAWSEEKPGTAAMAMKMLTKGTTNYSEGELAEELETYAISIAADGQMDTSSITMSCVSDQFEKAMTLLGEVTLKPTFPDCEFAKLQKQVLTGLSVSSNEPEYIVEREYRRNLYDEHPYARTAIGEIDDVKCLNTTDLKNWYNKFVRPDMAVLIIAGDISEESAIAIAEKTFATSNWTASCDKPTKQLPKINQPTENHIYLVDRPGSIQSQILVGQIAITRKDKQYPTSRLVSNYFGWGFNSRLNKTVRVAKGLTYSVWGSYIAQNLAGDFRIGTFTKTDSTAQALSAVLSEIKKLKTDPPTETELKEGQSYMLGSFAGRRETPQQIAGDLWLIASQNLGDDYMDRLMRGIAETTSENCTSLIERTIEPDKMIIVVVGEADKLKADLEKIAPVTIIPSANKRSIINNKLD